MKNINTELHHVYHPFRLYFVWLLLYVILVVGAIFLFNFFAGNLRTYTIPLGGVSIITDYDTYLAGEPISLTINNNYNSTLYIKNNCPNEPLAIYKYTKSDWQRQHASISQVRCTSKDQLISIRPGHSRTQSLKEWSMIFKNPGTYRIAVMVEYFDTVAYKDIQIIAKPKQTVKIVTVPKASTAIQQSSPLAPAALSPKPSGSSSGEGSSTPSKSQDSAKQTRTISTKNGFIKVAYDQTSIDILSINPASGCTYESGGNGGREVEVTFKCGKSETQIHLELENRQLNQEVESEG